MAAVVASEPVPFVASRWLVLAIARGHDLDLPIGADFNADHAQPGGDHSLDGPGHVALTKCGWPAGLAHFRSGFRGYAHAEGGRMPAWRSRKHCKSLSA